MTSRINALHYIIRRRVAPINTLIFMIPAYEGTYLGKYSGIGVRFVRNQRKPRDEMRDID